MTRDDILRMAREVADKDKVDPVSGQPGEEFVTMTPEELERFAALVAAEVRKTCEMACAEISADKWALYKGHKPYTGREPGRADDFTQGQSDGAELCEQAIKAMGTK